jgi:hypothetical protein
LETFEPAGAQIAGALALIAVGIAVTQLVAWAGGAKSEGAAAEDAPAAPGPK